MPCILDDLSLFIGLTSLPLGDERRFSTEIIQKIFHGYRKRIKESMNGSFIPEVYEPRSYVLLSEHDLAVLSLIDDTFFPALTFRSGEASLWHGDDDDDEETTEELAELFQLDSFAHHGMGNFVPRFGDRSIQETWQSIFPEPDQGERLPLIMITQFKISSPASLAGGTRFLRSILWAIVQSFNEFNDNYRFENPENDQNNPNEESKQPTKLAPNLRLMLGECHSWNEITMLVWGDSFHAMGAFLSTLGEINFDDYSGLLERLVKRKEGQHGADQDGVKQLRLEFGMLDDQTTLLESWLGEGTQIGKNHIFENSISHLGFDVEIFNAGTRGWRELTGLAAIRDKRRFKVVRRWFARRGHLRAGYETVHPGERQPETFHICFEKGDFFHDIDEMLDAETLIDRIIESRSAVAETTEQHLTRAITSVGIDIPLTRAGGPVRPHRSVFDHQTRSYAVSQKDIKDIFRLCRERMVPKVITTKVLNCLSALNEGLLDRVTMAAFYDLHCLPAQIKAILNPEQGPEGQGSPAAKTMMGDLARLTDWFEVAYRNRIHSNYRLGSDSSDVSLDYKGAIHQLITGLDGAYKAIATAFGNPHAYACVGSVPTSIQVTKSSVQFNFLYVMQPELAAMALVHEAAHFLSLKGLPKHPTTMLHQARSEFCRDQRARLDGLERSAAEGIDGKYRQALFRTVRNQHRRFYGEVVSDIANYIFAFGEDFDHHQWWTRHFAWQNVRAPSQFRDSRAHWLRFQGVLRNMAVLKTLDPVAYDRTARAPPSAELEAITRFLDVLLDPAANIIYAWVQTASERLQGLFETAFGGQNAGLTYKDAVEDNIRKLEVGQVCEFEPKLFPHGQQALAQACTLFNAMLRLIYRRYRNDDCKLLRDDKGAPMPREGQPPYLFDPRGGVFIHDSQVRRDVLKWRAAFHMSLWDLTAKTKAAQLRKEA